MPLLQQQADTHDEVTVIFVHRTRTESRGIAREYLSRFRRERGTAITDPVVWDPEDVFYQKYFSFGMPEPCSSTVAAP